MKNIFKPGDKKTYTHRVVESDLAHFETGTVHRLYSTFAIARDAEWDTRLFVLEMKESDEEGIGTFVHVDHHSPAFPGEEILFVAEVESISGNEIICKFVASAGERKIASGKTGQKILKREKLERIFAAIQP